MKYFRRFGIAISVAAVTCVFYHFFLIIESKFHTLTPLDIVINDRITIALAFTVSFLVTLLGD